MTIKPTTPRWTDERLVVLKNMWLAGISSGLIATNLGVTRNAVIGKLRRLGLMGRNELNMINGRSQPSVKKPRVETRPRNPYKKRKKKVVNKRPSPHNYIFYKPKTEVQTKGEIRQEFEQIWLNTVKIQEKMRCVK